MKQDRSLVGKAERWKLIGKRNNVNTRRKRIFMREAIAEAKKAEGLAEVPIGAVIVRQGKLLAAGII